MGIMDRLSQLIRANINDLIDSAEDPEKMLEQILRDMQTNIVQARSQVAAMIAQEKELEADVSDTQQLADEWGKKAARAVEAGKDDLAKEALRRKRDNEQNSQVYQQQLAVQQQAVEKLKDQVRQLEVKYQGALSQRDTLVARQRRVTAQRQVAEQAIVFNPTNPSAELDRMERKIRGDEARAAAAIEVGDNSFEAQFEEMENDDVGIDNELAELKKRLGKGPATPSLAPGGSSAGATQSS
ncbi:MAG TPA: PspA/IM30 family protein [Thermomicrobiales bacterium]|nr:PspA/IM30 family protein [Thermomicrobiales bacterium]